VEYLEEEEMPQQNQKNNPSAQRGLNIGEDILSMLMLANQGKTVANTGTGLLKSQKDKAAFKTGGASAVRERRKPTLPSKTTQVAKALTDVRPGLKNRVIMDLPTQLDYAHQTYQAFNPKDMGYGYQEGNDTPDDTTDDFFGEEGRDYTYNQLLAIALKNGLNIGTDIGIDIAGGKVSGRKGGLGPSKLMGPSARKQTAKIVGSEMAPGLQMAKDYAFQNTVEPMIDKAVQRYGLGSSLAHGTSKSLGDFDTLFGTNVRGAAKKQVDSAFDFMGGASKFESNYPISKPRRGEKGELDPQYGDLARIMELLQGGQTPAQDKFMSDLQAKYKTNDDKVLQPVRTAAASARQNVAATKTSMLGSLIGKIVQHFGQ
jgi:hypothetical protein